MKQMDQDRLPPEAAELLKDKKAVESLLASRDAKKLVSLLEEKAGDGGLQKLAQAALKGDPSGLMALMDQVTASREGAQAVERITRELPGK
jgi:hypothetical protein